MPQVLWEVWVAELEEIFIEGGWEVKVKGGVGEGGGEVSVERVKWERRELGVRIILRIEEGGISCRPGVCVGEREREMT